MVDQTPQQCKWKATPPTTSQHDHRIGCVKYRVGSPLWIAEDQRSVVSRRGEAAYQLQRAVSSFPSIAGLWERQERDSCQTQGRQHHSYVLYQSHGGHTLPTDDVGDVRTVELEPGKEFFFVGRAPTWEVEPGGRSGVKDAGRQFRVEAEATGVQAVDGADGPMSKRLICITSDSTVGEVHELEAGSSHGTRPEDMPSRHSP